MAENFELRKDDLDHWYWVLFSAKGEVISRSPETYTNLADCFDSIKIVRKDLSKINVFDMTKDPIEILRNPS